MSRSEIQEKQSNMTPPPKLRVLFFDVFGTCVGQRTPVADELWKAAQEALKSDSSSMSSEVRTKATNMVCPSQSRMLITIERKLISMFIDVRSVVRARRGT